MATAKKKTTTMKRQPKRPPKGSDDRIIVVETKQVPTDSLQGYYKNPRIGDVDAIAISLDQNGQYRPILVNIGTLTGRENEILAGNHTWLGARRELTYRDGEGNQCFKESYPFIYASFIDVDEDTAKKIVLADNKTADGGSYEESVLAELFASLPDVTGTGYSKDEVDDILAGIDDLVSENTKSVDDFLNNMPDVEEEEGIEAPPSQRRQLIEERNKNEERQDAAARRGATVVADEEEDKDIEEIDVSAELQVVLELKEENLYKGDNDWGVPELLPDKLMTRDELPEVIKTWGGKDATPDDGKTTWLYNYGLGGRGGLPIDRTIMSFFAQDAKFAQWWELPAYYTARYISEGLKYIINPDYSYYMDEARAHHMQSQYRSMWMGRFFQEAGLIVIPRIQFDFTDPNATEVALLGQPRGAEVFASSQQNLTEPGSEEACVRIMQEMLDELEPKTLLLYGGNPAKRVGQKLKNVEVIHIENYAAVRRATVFDKKDGAAKLTAKQKKELKEKHGGGKKRVKQADIDLDEVYDEDE